MSCVCKICGFYSKDPLERCDDCERCPKNCSICDESEKQLKVAELELSLDFFDEELSFWLSKVKRWEGRCA